MPLLESRTAGRLHLTLAGVFLTYYTLWVFGSPFVEEKYRPAFHLFFPVPVEVALGAPAFVATTVFMVLLARAYQLVRQDRREAEERRSQ